MQLDAAGHYRFYSPYSQPLKKIKCPAPRVILEQTNWKTEKDMVRAIYEAYGPGEYAIQCWRTGHEGVYIFWKGMINEDGFTFYHQVSAYQKEINKLKYKLAISGEEDRDWIKDEMELNKELKDLDKNTSYGFAPFLKPSGRRGTFISWENATLAVEKPMEDWGKIEEVQNQAQTEEQELAEWGITHEEFKKSKRKESFEKW